MRIPLNTRVRGRMRHRWNRACGVVLLTVRRANTLEAVTLHNTCEALTLGLANGVDLLACFEEAQRSFLTEGILRSICGTQLDNVTTGGNTGLLEVTSQEAWANLRESIAPKPI